MKRTLDPEGRDDDEAHKKARTDLEVARSAITELVGNESTRAALAEALFFNENGGPAVLSGLREMGLELSVPDTHYAKLLKAEFRSPVSLAPSPLLPFIEEMRARLDDPAVFPAIPMGHVLRQKFWYYAYFYCSLMARMATVIPMANTLRWVYKYVRNPRLFATGVVYPEGTTPPPTGSVVLELPPLYPAPHLIDLDRKADVDALRGATGKHGVPTPVAAMNKVIERRRMIAMSTAPEPPTSAPESDVSEDFGPVYDVDTALASSATATIQSRDPASFQTGIAAAIGEPIRAVARDFHHIDVCVLLVVPYELTGRFHEMSVPSDNDPVATAGKVPQLAWPSTPAADIAPRLWRTAQSQSRHTASAYFKTTLQPGINKYIYTLVDHAESGFRVLQLDCLQWFAVNAFNHRTAVRYILVESPYTAGLSLDALYPDGEGGYDKHAFALADRLAYGAIPQQRDPGPYHSPENVWGNREWIERMDRLRGKRATPICPSVWACHESIDAPGRLIEFPALMMQWLKDRVNPDYFLEVRTAWPIPNMDEVIDRRHLLLCYWYYILLVVVQQREVPADSNGIHIDHNGMIHYRCRACQSPDVTHVEADGSAGYCADHAGPLL